MHRLRMLRWRIGASDRIVVLATLFVSIGFVIVLVADVRMAILDAIRGYVHGEGLWSKGQKAAVVQLIRYAETQDEAHFRGYEKEIAVPLGDQEARLELEKAAPDAERVRAGFIQGKNHPDDIPGMITLFRRFRNTSDLAEAIDIWTQADEEIDRVRDLADKLHAEIASGRADPLRVNGLVERIADADARLTPLEDGFSETLGRGARRAQFVLTLTTYSSAIALLVLGVVLSRRMLRAERKERESADLKQAILDATLDCIVTTDHRGCIVEFNPAAERTFGYAREEALGRPAGELIVPPVLRAAHRRGLERYQQTGDNPLIGRRVEVTAMRKDGSEFPAELAVAVIGPTGRRAEQLFAAAVRDLSQQKQAEKAMREAEERQRALDSLRETQRFVQRIADATPHILYLFDLEEVRLTYINRQVGRILGWQANAPQPPGPALLREYVHPEDVTQLEAQLATRLHDLRDHEVIELDVRLKHLSGEWRWLRIRSIVFARNEAGRPKQILGTAEDVTERRRAEELIRQHEAELAHVLRVSTLGEMATGLAHELNQPLAAIVNYARGCARRLQNGASSAAELLPAIEQISVQALHAGEVIHHLRALVCKAQPARERIDLNDVVRAVARLAAPEADRREVSIRLELSGSPVLMVGDRIQMEQVVLNLVRNGFDALGDRGEGEVIIRTANEVDGTLHLSVHDTGAGLAPEVAAHVFEPFFTTKTEGMGMGLAISRSMVVAHGGELFVDPSCARGATFHIRLPATAAPGTAGGPGSAAGENAYGTV